MPVRLALLALALVWALPAHALTVLNTGKVASFRNGKGMVRVGADRGLATPTPPTCPQTSHLSLSSYPQATKLVVVHVDLDLDCSGWSAGAGGYVWEDPTGTAPVRKIVYSSKKLVVKMLNPETVDGEDLQVDPGNQAEPEIGDLPDIYQWSGKHFGKVGISIE